MVTTDIIAKLGMASTTPQRSMKVVRAREPGPAEVLQVVDAPMPQPGRREVLVRITAAGLNRADLSQRMGRYPVPPGTSDILGMELAGEIVALGRDVKRWTVGDSVCALVVGGAYAEYCVVPDGQCLPLPKGYDMVRAAALPEAALTVWHNLYQRGRLKAGETVLIHGGSSGIGTMAIQIARMFGAKVIVTAGSDEKCRACVHLGAHVAINYRSEDFVTRAKEETNGLGVDVILDMVAGPYVPRNLEALALEGRVVTISLQGGQTTEINCETLMRRRLTFAGSTLRPQSVAAKSRITRAVERHIWPLIESGTIAPVIQAVFPLSDAVGAHKLMETGTHIGKIILQVR